MRFLLQTLGLLIIVWLGWNQPYRDVSASVFPWANIAPSRLGVKKARAELASTMANSPDGAQTSRREPFKSTSSLNQPAKPSNH
jgi:hypothetical protein